MRLEKIHDVLAVYARAPKVYSPEGLKLILDFAAEFPRVDTSQLQLVPQTHTERRHNSGTSITDVASDLQHIYALLRSAGMNSGVVNDIALLTEVLQRAESDYLEPMLENFKAYLRPPAFNAEAFIERLRADQKTPRFEATFAELAQSNATVQHLQDIALRLSGAKKKPTTKKAALASIRRPHDAYMNAKHGIDASGGRSAA